MSIRATLDARGLRPQKKWGQHFLTDTRILESIADAAKITRGDTVLEIGPGLGHLTRVLAARAGRVVAVEVDRGLSAKLAEDFADAPNVEIVQDDIIRREPIEFLRKQNKGVEQVASIPFTLVANLPYYITSAILQHVLQAAHKPRIAVVMVQREVAQRIIAQPPAMSVLAVSVQFFARARIVRVIPAGAFYPRPKVDSAVVRLDVFDQPPIAVADAPRFFEIVRAGFSGRRKQLRNSLARGLALEPEAAVAALMRARIDPTRRAETLTLEEWGALFHAFESRKPLEREDSLESSRSSFRDE
jgi:16S rRNA (adenine1518-N6/adenine1519-N6)-dimethyltransferase